MSTTPSRRLLLASAASLFVLPFATAGIAATPGRHPSYLHALTDLRTARWLLRQRSDNPQAAAAVQHIEAAVGDIKAAAWEDGKNLDDHPHVDVPPDWNGTLHRSLELLRGVRRDIAQPEDDPAARGLQNRSLHNVDEAIRHVRYALGEK